MALADAGMKPSTLIFAALCGPRLDDLYASPGTLQRIVDTLGTGKYAMVIGSYTIVNSRLEEMPPGFIDHREWTVENGHNNALRINWSLRLKGHLIRALSANWVSQCELW
ncbi:MAG: hypothetical protein MZU91_06340 [Desulfosudis oleivorans]|nr:hypothetical protein [Desulfosudis oleivorans]